jgi:peptidoglycan/xylan/chitin deacetylase (PgdA/CDA1 family)
MRELIAIPRVTHIAPLVRIARQPAGSLRQGTMNRQAIRGILHGLGPGQPLPQAARAGMEARLGHDLSAVRVHGGADAAAAARHVHARAFTAGHDIVFGRGEYQPAAMAGRRLLAHELTHVIQQAAGRAPPVQLVELTYDDGPDSAGYTKKVLDELNKAGARATFYVVGQRVVEGDNWRTVFEIAASGHWLGNHAFDWNSDTDNHIFLRGAEKERARKILIAEWAIRDALIKGKEDAETSKTWAGIPADNQAYIEDVIAHGTGRFRTPGFKSKWWRSADRDTMKAIHSVNRILAAAGLRPYDVSDEVDVDPKDWKSGRTQAEIEKAVIGDVDSDESVLLHSRIAASAAATPAIVKAIKDKGWTFEAPSQGALGSVRPGKGFADLSSVSSPPTAAEVAKARKFFFAKMKYLGPIIAGETAIAVFQLAQMAGPTEVQTFMNELDTTRITTDSCKNCPVSLWLQESWRFGLFYRFYEAWSQKKAFPRGKGVY